MKPKVVSIGLRTAAVMCLFVTVASNAFCQAPPPVSKTSLAPLHSRAMETVRAEEIEVIVAKLFPGTMFSAESTTNTLYFRCDDQTRKDVESFLTDAEARAQLQMRERDDAISAISKAQRQTAAAESQETTVVVELAHISPSEALNVISDLGINARATATGNSVIFKTADVEQKKELIALFQRIDVPLSEGRSSSPQVAEASSGLPSAIDIVQPRTAAAMAEAFKAKQAILRMQIKSQKEKLRMLEQRLEEREKMAKEYFGSLNIQETSEAAIPELLDIRPEDIEQVRRYPTGKDIELPLPVESELDAASLIREFGGWYELNSHGHIEEINMVYFNDESGNRFENPIRDESFLTCVPELPELRKLYLQGRQVTDQGMICVGQCKNLTDFFVWDCAGLSDSGIRHLAEHPNLENIHIDSAGITDRSLQLFGRLPKIKRLALQENEFGDKGLKALSRASTLEEIWVGRGENKFSDSGIRELLKLKRLKKLDIQHSPVSSETLQAFRTAGIKLVYRVL